MDLILNRNSYRKDGIFGTLQDEKGDWLVFTLEHAFPNGDNWEPIIPGGIYTCERGLHQLKGMVAKFETFEVTDVPGHSGLLFHWGNVNNDSEGCILVGKKLGELNGADGILGSRAAFWEFMQLQKDENTFRLEIID